MDSSDVAHDFPETYLLNVSPEEHISINDSLEWATVLQLARRILSLIAFHSWVAGGASAKIQLKIPQSRPCSVA